MKLEATLHQEEVGEALMFAPVSCLLPPVS